MSNKAINWAKRQKVGNPAGLKTVLLVHADHANEHGASWPKKKTVSDAVGLSLRTVENYERLLIERGLLIPVPWVHENGREGRKGFFMGFARRKDGGLPDLSVAFKARIEFKDEDGDGRNGKPRLSTPSWWSGDKKKAETGHKCTSCGGTCHGPDEYEPEDAWDPREGPMESWGEPVGEGASESFEEWPEDSGWDPRGVLPVGGWEGPTCGTPEGPARGTPLTLRKNPQGVTPGDSVASAITEVIAGHVAPLDVRNAGSERASGLPAGRIAKPATREHGISDQPPESAPSLRLSVEEKRQREREAIHSAIAALERLHGFEQAHKTIEMALMAVEWAAGDVRDAARDEALEAIRPPGWHNADTARRYELQVDAHTLAVALSSRPLASWPSAVTELLGLSAAAA